MTYDEFIQGIIDTRGRFGIHSEEYHERHHIVPKCMGGTNDEENLIDLFAREHYEAHKLLALENPDNRGLQIAWLNMSTTKNQYHKREVVTAEEFEQARKACSRAMSGSGNPMYGVRLLGEKAGRYGIPFSEESRRKISEHHADVSGENNPMYGKHHTIESKEKMSIAKKGRKPTLETRRLLSEMRKGKYLGKDNSNAKVTYQYDLDWNLVAAYDCLKEASNITGYGYSTLGQAISSGKSSHGYYWTYEMR